jgi:hypothetical protein
VKRLGVLSLRAVAVLLSDRRDQIGIGDDKENKKHVLGARRLADKAPLDHAFMMRAYRDGVMRVCDWSFTTKNIVVKLLVNQK